MMIKSDDVPIQRVPPEGGSGLPRKKYYFIGRSLFEIDTEYKPVKAIGEGSFGVVCSAIYSSRIKTERVAIKKITDVFRTKGVALGVLREMKLLRNIKHRNIIGLKDVMLPSQKFNDVYLVFECMHTDLERVIVSPKTPLSLRDSRYLLYELLEGVNYLHSANILHRDLKPANVFVSENLLDLKIGDFGMAKIVKGNTEPLRDCIGTLWYSAPEVLLGCEKYGPAIDVWSVGCIFAEMIGRRPLFMGSDQWEQLEKILLILGTQDRSELQFIDDVSKRNVVASEACDGIGFDRYYPHADSLAIDLLQKMLVFNPEKRITTAQALEHPYFNGFTDTSKRSGVPADIEVEDTLETTTIREMMWTEMLHHRLQHKTAV